MELVDEGEFLCSSKILRFLGILLFILFCIVVMLAFLFTGFSSTYTEKFDHNFVFAYSLIVTGQLFLNYTYPVDT